MNEIKLDEIYEFSSGLSKPASEFGFGYPFLGFKDVFYNSAIPKELNELVNSNKKEIERCSIKRGDVFLTRTSETQNELGMSCVALEDLPNATFNGFTKRLRPKKENIVIPEYARYFFRSKFFRRQINAYSSLSTRASLNNEMLSNFKIILHPKKYQEAIGSILQKLDHKIELNQKMNGTLEDIAKTLFKSWFIDFDPVRAKAEGRPTGLSKEISDLFPDSFEDSESGEIPKGWKVSQVKDFCSVIQKGIAPKYTENQSYPVINQKCIRNLEINFDLCRFTEYKKVMEDRYLENFDILLNSMGTGTLGRSALFVEHHKKAVVDGCISVIRGKSKNFGLYVYQSISRRENEIINLSHGSTGQTTLKTEDIGNLNLIQPTNELIELFSKSVADLKLKKYSNSQENKVLSNLRDTLLPKLISGELKIQDAENLVEEAGI